MARLNIEEQWWTDPRRFKLIEILGGDEAAEDAADIAMIRIWRVALQFWKAGQRPIPKPVFMKMKHAKEVLKVGLAKHKGSLIYIKGSSISFRWVIEYQLNGKAGGAASGRSRREKLEANSKRTRSELEASSSSSSSSSKELNTNTAREEKISEPEKSDSDLKPSRQPDLKFQIQSCLDEWKETLLVRNIERDPRLDANKIGRLIQVYDVERVRSAIRGMRFEPSGKDFNPNANCYIARLEKPDAFNRLETIGSSKANKPVEKKLYKHAQV